jgi:hypothetical protein
VSGALRGELKRSHRASGARDVATCALVGLLALGCGEDAVVDPAAGNPVTPGGVTSASVTGLSALPGTTAGSVSLQWQPPPTGLVVIYFGTAPGVTPQSGVAFLGTGGTYNHLGLVAGKRYWFVAAVRDANGEGPPTAEVSATARKNIALELGSPRPQGVVADSVAITLKVTSLYSVAGATGRIGSVSTALVFDPPENEWKGSLSLASLTSPSDRQFVATVVDMNGDTAVAAAGVRFDRPPVVTVTSPAPFAVLRPSTSYSATCIDDGATGCDALTVTIAPTTGSSGAQQIATGRGSVAVTTSLPAYEGQTVFVLVEGRDSLGQRTEVRQRAYVESAARLIAVDDGGAGILVGATSDRLFVMDSVGKRQRVRAMNRSTRTATTMVLLAPAKRSGPVLTAGGMTFIPTESEKFSNTPQRLYLWSGASLDSASVYNSHLAAAGGFAAWNETYPGTIALLDATTGALSRFGANATLGDVSADGWAVFTSSGAGLQTWRAGATTPIAVGSVDQPRTDGTRIVFAHSDDSIAVWDGAVRTTLAIFPGGSALEAGRDYQINSGWIAFLKQDANQMRQVWLRSPAGALTQVTNFGASSTLELLGPDGTLVLRNSASGSMRRYRLSPGSAPVDIGSGIGTPVYVGGTLHVMIGSGLFRVD